MLYNWEDSDTNNVPTGSVFIYEKKAHKYARQTAALRAGQNAVPAPNAQHLSVICILIHQVISLRTKNLAIASRIKLESLQTYHLFVTGLSGLMQSCIDIPTSNILLLYRDVYILHSIALSANLPKGSGIAVSRNTDFRPMTSHAFMLGKSQLCKLLAATCPRWYIVYRTSIGTMFPLRTIRRKRTHGTLLMSSTWQTNAIGGNTSREVIEAPNLWVQLHRVSFIWPQISERASVNTMQTPNKLCSIQFEVHITMLGWS